MKIKLQTAPTFEPISVEEAMLAARIDENSGYEENLIAKYLTAAINRVEDYTSRKLCTQTWDYYLDTFPASNSFKIPFGNLASVTHIKYTDSNGTETTMTVTTDYLVETNGEGCGRIVLPYGVSWPSFTAYTSHPIVIRFVCGWTTAALVPDKIKAAILLFFADLYQNREYQVLSSFDYKQNPAIKYLLATYRLHDEF